MLLFKYVASYCHSTTKLLREFSCITEFLMQFYSIVTVCSTSGKTLWLWNFWKAGISEVRYQLNSNSRFFFVNQPPSGLSSKFPNTYCCFPLKAATQCWDCAGCDHPCAELSLQTLHQDSPRGIIKNWLAGVCSEAANPQENMLAKAEDLGATHLKYSFSCSVYKTIPTVYQTP